MSFLDRLTLAPLILLALAAAGPHPDPAFQKPIDQAVSSIVRQDDDAPARLETLRALGSNRRQELLLQLALYLEIASGTERSMAGALILRELAFTPQEKLDAIAPQLDHAGPGLRRVLTELLSTVDRPEGGDPDFHVYEDWIRRRKEDPPGSLILYMYEVSPDAALATLEGIYGAGPQAPRPDPADPSALSGMARDPAWWRRLYAAALLYERPDPSTRQVAERLRNDPHPLVRRAAAGG